MATLALQTIATGGLEPSYDAADAAGDQFTASQHRRTFLHVKNGDTSSKTVTITSHLDSLPAGASKADHTVDVPAGSDVMIGPITHGLRDVDDLVSVAYDDVTSVTVAVLVID